MKLEVIVLAAGLGRRMHSALPKVLHPVGGRPMLLHLLESVAELSPHRVHVVVGSGREQVIEAVRAGTGDEPQWVTQEEQKGTGHAVLQAMPGVGADSHVLVLNGDVPLMTPATLRSVCTGDDALGLVTAWMDDPAGMGRVLRDGDGQVTGIVEERDADDAQKQVREINTNCMCAPARRMNKWLLALDDDNVQNEIYLTGVVGRAVADGVTVSATPCATADEAQGVNSRADLQRVERIFQRRCAEELMAGGLTLMDAARFDLRGACRFGADCVVDVNVVLEGEVSLGERVRIGPNVVIRNSHIGDDTEIDANCVIDSADIGGRCRIGPFARIRPDSRVMDQARVGNFVEIKNSVIGAGSKVNHLSYVGDSEVGGKSNVGAGVITVNYDGVNKFKTRIGDDVFVGSGSQLIAPLSVAGGATIGAGSTITHDVGPGQLAVGRSRQRNIDNWKRPKKV